jgi:hypothetical protein
MPAEKNQEVRSMTHATLRENDTALHHIVSETGITGILATAGLLAEALNYRNGFASGHGQRFALSVISEGFEGVFSVDEYTIRETGSFWLLS